MEALPLRHDLPTTATAAEPMVSPRVELQLAAIEQAWRQVNGRALHGPNCSCCGAQPIILEADALTEGIEYALLARFRAADDQPCMRLLASHPLGSNEDFVAWLRRLAAGDNDAALPILRLVEDMLLSIGPGSTTRR